MATTKTDNLYFDAPFKKDDYILFGSETKGLDEKILLANPEQCITIPMGGKGRSLESWCECRNVLFYDACTSEL